MKKKLSATQILCLVGMIVGGVGKILTDYANEKKQQDMIEEKVNAAVEKRLAGNEESV